MPTASSRVSAPGPVVLPDAFRQTGVLFRILFVDGARGNTAEGYVRPGVIPFEQSLSQGTWSQTVTFGQARVLVDGEDHTFYPGDSFDIQAGQRFTLLNETPKPWGFKLQNPPWGTGLFSYNYQGLDLAGDEVWFQMRTEPDSPNAGPTFRLFSAAPNLTPEGFVFDPTLCVVVVEPGEQTAITQSLSGGEQLTLLRGKADIVFTGVAERRDETMEAPQAMLVPNRTPYLIRNLADSLAMVQIEPVPPRVWTPESIVWDFGQGFNTGAQIWFELVLPI
jgi:hypothetical protein